MDSFQPALARVSYATRQKFAAGRAFEAEYKALFPKGIDVSQRCHMNLSRMLHTTRELLGREGEVDLFEAAFLGDEVLILADVVHKGSDGMLTVYEVKHTPRVTPVIRHDVYLQHYVIREDRRTSPAPDVRIHVAYHDAEGHFLTEELTAEALAHSDFVREHISLQKEVLAGLEPVVEMGAQCDNPYPCPYAQYCRGELSAQLSLGS